MWVRVQVYRVRLAWRHAKEKTLMAVAWHIPRNLAYWCYIRVMAHATTGKFGNTHPDEATFGVAAGRWHEPNGLRKT